MTLPEDLRQLLLALNAHGVEYLVVGGWAVGFYSDPRSTKDIDLLIRADQRNSEAVFKALAEFGAPLAGVSPADFRDHPTAEFQIGHEPVRADILQSIDAVLGRDDDGGGDFVFGFEVEQTCGLGAPFAMDSRTYAATSKRSVLGRFLWDACHMS
jgi:hypothetical protein